MPAKKRPTAKDAVNPTASPKTPKDTSDTSSATQPVAAHADPTSTPAKKTAAKRSADATKSAKTASAKTASAKTASQKTASKKSAAAKAPATPRAAGTVPAATTPAANASAAQSTFAADATTPNAGPSDMKRAPVSDTPVALTQTREAAPAPTPAKAISEASIRQHAYFLSLHRNGSGDPVADWLEAERALRAMTD